MDQKKVGTLPKESYKSAEVQEVLENLVAHMLIKKPEDPVLIHFLLITQIRFLI